MGSIQVVKFDSSYELIKEIKSIFIKANSLTETISDVSIKDPDGGGENFASKTKEVIITFECGRKLELFVKKRTDSPEHNEMLDKCKLFEKEAEFYNKYIPFAKRCYGDMLNIYPKCYYADGSVIILENLSRRKYAILNGRGHDFQMARVALTTLAKHHAISHSLIRKLGTRKFLELFPKFEFKVWEQPKWREMLEPMFGNVLKRNIFMVERYGEREKNVELMKKWEHKRKYDELLQSIKADENEFLVVCHMDYWNNNMMFRAENNNLHEILVDFQLPQISTPSVDISFYLFTCAKPEVRKRLDDLIQIYLQALNTTLRELGSQSELGEDALKKDFCKHFHFGFWIGFTCFSGPGAEINEKVEIKEGQSMSEMFGERDRLELKWVIENKEKCGVYARNIIQFVEEYEKLRNGILF